MNESAIQAILAKPVEPESGRHTDILSRMTQLRANGMQREEAISAIAALYPIGSGAHRQITRKELADAYDGLDGLPLTPTALRGQFKQQPRPKQELKVKPAEPAAEPAASIPKDLTGTTPLQFLQAMFAPTDRVCIGWKDDKGQITKSEVRTLTEWTDPDIEALRKPTGLFYCFNPLDASGKRAAKNVVDWRYCLVESDNGTPHQQYANLLASGLPIAALYHSGNKSIHALVRIEASSLEEFNTRVEKVYEYMGCMKLGRIKTLRVTQGCQGYYERKQVSSRH